MNFQISDEYWEGAVTEIESLESMSAWEFVDHDDDMNVIKWTWVFKMKRYPYGFIKNFNTRFCSRGDMKL